MILPVFLRILILFAIVLVFLQTMIDQNSFDTEAEDQNISIHAGHPALRQSRKMSSGTALQRFPYDSIENRRNDLFSTTFWDSSFRQEPVPALAHACTNPAHDDPSFETMVVDAKRGGEGKVYSPADHGSVFPCVPASPRPSSRDGRGENFPPAENELELTALTASASCSSKSASTSWIRDVSSLSITCENCLSSKRDEEYYFLIASNELGLTTTSSSYASAYYSSADHGSGISTKIKKGWFMHACNTLHQKRGNSTKDGPSRIRSYFLSKSTMWHPSTNISLQNVELGTNVSPQNVELGTNVSPQNVELGTDVIPQNFELDNNVSPANIELDTIFSPTDDEYDLTALTATGCSYASANALRHQQGEEETTSPSSAVFSMIWPCIRLANRSMSSSLAIIAPNDAQSEVASAILILDFILSTTTLVRTRYSVTTTPTSVNSIYTREIPCHGVCPCIIPVGYVW